jgi:hypothetical protein
LKAQRRASIAASIPPRLCGTPGLGERELDGAERAQQHRLVQITHVTDAEYLPLQHCEAAAQCHAVAVRCDLAKRSASWPGGISTAVSESEAASGSSE